jgi:hypothetical protein
MIKVKSFRIESLSGTINQLQTAFDAINSPPINLFQILVLGSQSSVLKPVVGRNFLQQRRDIIIWHFLTIQLVKFPVDTNQLNEFSEFSHKTELFSQFDEIID